MKEMPPSDLKPKDQSRIKSITRAVRRPRKLAPEPENLRGWAKSSIKSRNKS